MVCLRPMVDFFGTIFRPLARYVAGGSEMVCPRTSFAVKTFGYTSFRKNPNHQELMVGKSKSLNSTGWREMRKNQTSLTHTIICKRFIIDFFSVAFRSVRILWPLTSSSLAYPIYKLLYDKKDPIIPKTCESLPGMIGSKIEMMQSIDF